MIQKVNKTSLLVEIVGKNQQPLFISCDISSHNVITCNRNRVAVCLRTV